MTAPCGCCEGVERVTPIAIANRPGLDALAYRVGTHATFLETMLARLPGMHVGEHDAHGKPVPPPLLGLTARTPDDPAIALLDAWATVADVLTFYQERIANEGYLRTATERRSILELARLVGYRLRPGVAASVYLAYMLEPDARVEIPAGSRAQSLPGPGELPQPFETSEPLHARAEWSNLRVRLTRPQNIKRVGDNGINTGVVYFEGTATNLEPNDPLLFVFGHGNREQVLQFVERVQPDSTADRTKVTLQGGPPDAGEDRPRFRLADLVEALSVPSSFGPRSAARLVRRLDFSFAPTNDVISRALVTLSPSLRDRFYQAWANASISKPPVLQRVEALRVKAPLFGHNLSVRLEAVGGTAHAGHFTIAKGPPFLRDAWKGFLSTENDKLKVLLLDAVYDQIKPGSWLVVERDDDGSEITTQCFRVHSVRSVSLVVLGVSARVTQVTLEMPWLKDSDLGTFLEYRDRVQRVTVYAAGDTLKLSEEPIDAPIGGCSEGSDEDAGTIELNGLYGRLESGRWLIVSGERADINVGGETVGGVRASELAMVSGVTQDVHRIDIDDDEAEALPGDKTHSFIELSTPLSYCYKRDTVTIYGNVVHATHGETREEILGSSDGSKALQEFALRQSPLTYLPASTAAGAASTLRLRANGVEWREADSLAELGLSDRKFIAKTDDRNKTTLIFGNGERGARLPMGVENVKAVYRTGIGKPGNAEAGQISLLATRPLGVKGVINPQHASGGADADSRDQARRNAPLAVMALDRLVSVQDYADFARSFAGIGKASAVRVTDGHRQLVHVTIAGVEDVPIEGGSDLYRNLLRALHQHGDPYQPIKLAVRELLLLVIGANVRVLPEYEWESVAPRLRSALLETFSFERRELGQDVFLSEVVSTMQAVEGVDYVDVDTLAPVDEEKVKGLLAGNGGLDFGLPENGRLGVEPAVPDDKVPGVIRPAKIAFLTPAVPDTLILNLVE